MQEIETCYCEKCQTSRPVIDQLTLVLNAENWPASLLFAVLVILCGKMCAVDSLFVNVMAFSASVPTFAEFGYKAICKDCRTSLADALEEAI